MRFVTALSSPRRIKEKYARMQMVMHTSNPPRHTNPSTWASLDADNTSSASRLCHRGWETGVGNRLSKNKRTSMIPLHADKKWVIKTCLASSRVLSHRHLAVIRCRANQKKERDPSMCKLRMNHTEADTSLIVPVTSSYHRCQVKRWNHHIRGGGEDIFWHYLMSPERFFSKQQRPGSTLCLIWGKMAALYYRSCNSWLVDLFIIWIGFKKIH